MQWIVLFLTTLLSTHSFAHEIFSSTQHVNLRKQNESGWQQDLIARLNVNSKWDVGAQATYLERFNLFDKRLGGFVGFRPIDRWSFEVKYLQGMGNEILPEKDFHLLSYYSLAPGFSPYLYYKDSRYSFTHLHTATLGLEIEKIRNIIFIPSVMLGRATFKSPGKTEDVYSYGLRVNYYVEKKYSLTAFTYRGKEASQGIIGRSAILVDTWSGGLGGSYYFTPDFKGELIFDHTDYQELGTEFHTTTLNLSRMF